MKKKMMIILVMGCLLLVGCSNKKEKEKHLDVTGVKTDHTETSNAKDDTKIVAPLPAKLSNTDWDDMPDGEYSVSFQGSNLEKKEHAYQLKMEFYDYDIYAMKDVNSLTVKDVIKVRGEEIKIKSIAWDKNNKGKVFGVEINGGTEEDGISLRLEKDCYHTTSLDDFPLYYSIGTKTLTLSKDLVVQDCYDYNTLPEGVKTGYNQLPNNIIKANPEYWTEMNTLITVKDGKVIKIHRNWTP